MYNINEHIVKELYNEYGGSERKKTVLLDDSNKYLLKLPDPIREKGKQLSYINNAYSEYISCKIVKDIGLPVQGVILGEYTYIDRKGQEKTRAACLCKDIRKPGEQLYEIEKLSLSSYDDPGKSLSFESVENEINKIKGISTEELKNFYYDMFVVDAFIGNTDRHNGNWGILANNETGTVRIAPIYDCGSALLPLIGEEELPLVNSSNVFMSVTSAITDEGKRINYTEYLKNRVNTEVDLALCRIVPKINFSNIKNILLSTEGISDDRRELYRSFLAERYNRILVPALERIFKIKETAIRSNDDINLLKYYRERIEPITKMPLHTAVPIRDDFGSRTIQVLNNKYTASLDHAGRICGLIPTRSNNESVRLAFALEQRATPDIVNYFKKETQIARDEYER